MVRVTTAQLSAAGPSDLSHASSAPACDTAESTSGPQPATGLPQTFAPSKPHQHLDQLGLRENRVGKELSLSPHKAMPAHTMLGKTAGLPQDTSASVSQDKAL